MTETTRDTGRQLAALDLGSNSFHLIVVHENNGHLQVVDKYKEMVRLADGLGKNDSLHPDVAERALGCLERLGERLRGLHPDNVRVVGTNALRQAKKAGDFIAQAEQHLGHEIEIISGREEARLIYLGVSHNLEDSHDRRLVVDIGGGSTELIVGRHFQPLEMESLHMGCVSMSARWFPGGKIKRASFNAAVDAARQELEPVSRQFDATAWDTAIGASGTIVTIQHITNTLQDGSGVITRDGLDQLCATVMDAGHVNELDLPHLSNERRPVFAGGLAILKAIFDELHVRTMHTSGGALREGLVQDLLGRVHRHDIRTTTVSNLRERYHIDERHADRVRELAVALHAQVAADWALTEADHAMLLRWAADLHEIGMDIAHSGYHKHGGYLLQHMDMSGFSQLDQERLALLVRSHRRKVPMELFDEADRLEWLRLAVLLRLAVVLRRSRLNQHLPHIAASVNGNQLTVHIPQIWLDKHPLTRLDLGQEAYYLENTPISLQVEEI